MTPQSNVVERQWFAIAPDGTEHVLLLGVGPAARQPRGEWAATVSLGALELPHTIVGADSWQAIAEGMHHVAVLVRHHEKLGWKFYWERGGEPATANDLERSNNALEQNARPPTSEG